NVGSTMACSNTSAVLRLKLFSPTQGEKLCANAAECFVVVGTQVVARKLVTEFMDQQLDHTLCDSTLKPVGPKSQFVEGKLAAASIRRCAEVVWRCAEFHRDSSIQHL